MELSNKDARLLNLIQQGLISPIAKAEKVINRIGYVQIDTISVTERSHNHVIHSRVKNFHQKELDELMHNKKIFEYWSHAAAYLPVKDFRFSLYRKEQYKAGNKHCFPRDKKVDKYVLDRIKAEGPLQSKDFENPREKNHEWYQWKPAKIALTNLFMDGSIMISHRKGFQKVFDLTENVIPTHINTSTPTLEEYCKHLITNTISCFGIATFEEMCYLRKGIKPTLKNFINEMLETKEIIEISLTNNKNVYYGNSSIIEKALNERTSTPSIHILNPFDNLIIQRKRIKDIFDFDYLIECYVPEKKRIFGYYTLPILYGTEFIGRFDGKADRKTNVFYIKNLWLEKGFLPNDKFYSKFIPKLKTFSAFCGCEKIEVIKAESDSVKKKLKSLL